MKMKKIIVSSIATIALAASLASGATYALFTSSSDVNIAITSGKVNVKAEIKDFNMTSGRWVDTQYVDEDVTSAKEFINGGTALVDGNKIVLDRITPMDKVSFNVLFTNESNVDISYRTLIVCQDGFDLFKGLDVTVNGVSTDDLVIVSSWETMEANALVKQINIPISIELPRDAGNEFQGLNTEITVAVEAIQGNANTDGIHSSYLAIVNSNEDFNNAVKAGSNLIYIQKGTYDVTAVFEDQNVAIIGADVDDVVLTTKVDGTYQTPEAAYDTELDAFDTTGNDAGKLSYLGHFLFKNCNVTLKNLTIKGNEKWILANNISTDNRFSYMFASVAFFNSTAEIENVKITDMEFIRKDAYGNNVSGDYGFSDGFGYSILMETHPDLSEGSFTLAVKDVVINGFRKGGIMVREYTHGYSDAVVQTKFKGIQSKQIKLATFDNVSITGSGAPVDNASRRAQPGIEISVPFVVSPNLLITDVYDCFVTFKGVPGVSTTDALLALLDGSTNATKDWVTVNWNNATPNAKGSKVNIKAAGLSAVVPVGRID